MPAIGAACARLHARTAYFDVYAARVSVVGGHGAVAEPRDFIFLCGAGPQVVGRAGGGAGRIFLGVGPCLWPPLRDFLLLGPEAAANGLDRSRGNRRLDCMYVAYGLMLGMVSNHIQHEDSTQKLSLLSTAMTTIHPPTKKYGQQSKDQRGQSNHKPQPRRAIRGH